MLEDVFVKESERNKGIGSLIFAELIEKLKAEKVKYVALNVASNNLKDKNFTSGLVL